MSEALEEAERLMAEAAGLRERVEARIADLEDELARARRVLAILPGARPNARPPNSGRKPAGYIQQNGKGFRWNMSWRGTRYTGLTRPTRAEAEADLDEAKASIARGEPPKTARALVREAILAEASSPAGHMDEPEVVSEEGARAAAAGVEPVAPPADDDPAPGAAEAGGEVVDQVPVAPARPAPARRHRPDPSRVKMIAASAQRATSDLSTLSRGIDKLPPRLANVARRHWLRGQAPAIIARELGVREDAVQAMLDEARRLAGVATAAA